MKHVRRAARSGAVLLWGLVFALALLTTVVFTTDDCWYASPYVPLPCGSYQGYVGAMAPMAPSCGAVVAPQASYQGYRQEYRTLTNSLTAAGSSRFEQERAFQSYSSAYDASVTYRSQGW